MKLYSTKQIRDSVAHICRKYDDTYWRALDKEKKYPSEFVKEMTDSGFLNVLIPKEFGGSGLGLIDAVTKRLIVNKKTEEGKHLNQMFLSECISW